MKLFIELLITDQKEKHNNNTLEELQTQIKMFLRESDFTSMYKALRHILLWYLVWKRQRNRRK